MIKKGNCNKGNCNKGNKGNCNKGNKGNCNKGTVSLSLVYDILCIVKYYIAY